jgi:hypothetical protein
MSLYIKLIINRLKLIMNLQVILIIREVGIQGIQGEIQVIPEAGIRVILEETTKDNPY